jgi:hypothetical protein
MKKAFALLLIFGLGCQPFERQLVEPSLLFRTWNLITRSAGGVVIKSLVEFTHKGTLLYGSTKTDGGCCNPYNFAVESGQIRFFSQGELPGICAQVSCLRTELTAGIAWQIDMLDDKQLVLKTGGRELLFNAEP